MQPKTGLQRVRWCLIIPFVIPVYFKHGLPSLVGMMCKRTNTWETENHWELEYFKKIKVMFAKSDVLVSCLSSLTFPLKQMSLNFQWSPSYKATPGAIRP